MVQHPTSAGSNSVGGVWTVAGTVLGTVVVVEMGSGSTATEKKKIISLFQNVQISAVVLHTRTTWEAVSAWSV